MSNLNFDQVAANQNQKEVTINDAFDQVDDALTEHLAVDLSAADVSLTTDQWTRNWFFEMSGHTVARTVTLPPTKRPAVVKNAGTGAVTLQVLGGGSAVVQPAQTVMIYNDGANLTVSGGSAPTVSLDKARVYLNTATDTTSAGWQKIPLDAVDFDTNSLWDVANKRIVPKKAGYYQVTVRMRTNTAGSSVVSVALNGSGKVGVGSDGNANATGGMATVYCNGTTDYIELKAFANSVRALTTGTFDTWLSVLGPF